MDTGQFISPVGIDGLDEILKGGIPRGNAILVTGNPGTGKTTLCVQFIYAGAVKFKEPGIMVTFEESPARLIRDAHSFGWDIAAQERGNMLRIVQTSPDTFIRLMQDYQSPLHQEIRNIGARRIAVDSITLFKYQKELEIFREQIYSFINMLRNQQALVMLTAEESPQIQSEGYIADTLISLGIRKRLSARWRTIEVIKSRGQDFLTGTHTLEITGSGLRVYPRATTVRTPASTRKDKRPPVHFGVEGLDGILGSGIHPGSVVLLMGSAGIGKTTLALKFLVEGARLGEKSIYCCFEQTAESLIRQGASLGLPIDRYVDEGLVRVIEIDPVELNLNTHFHQLRELFMENGYSRIVFDSMHAYNSALTEDSIEIREFIFKLMAYTRSQGVTSLLINEMPHLSPATLGTEHAISFIADVVLLLRYVEINAVMRRGLLVMKSRCGPHARDLREFTIDASGITVFDEPLPVTPRDFATYQKLVATGG
ncbi:MAG: hypothetical protein HYY09_05795 [Firmicutes bacterium]|nr:hypothetical protein [Bacillota bacterium]